MIAQLAFIAAIILITSSMLFVVSCITDPIDQASDNRADSERLVEFHPFHSKTNSDERTHDHA